jgi:hypothetical protein
MAWVGNTVLRYNGRTVDSQPDVQAYRVDTGALHPTIVKASAAGVATFTDLVDGVGYVAYTYLGTQTYLTTPIVSPTSGGGGPGASHFYGASSAPNLLYTSTGILSWSDNLTQVVQTIDGVNPWTASIQHKHTLVNGAYYPIAINPLGGNVGIGTQTPTHLVSISGDLTTTGVSLYVNRNLAAAATDSAVAFIRQQHAGDDMPALQLEQSGTHSALVANNNAAAPGVMARFLGPFAGSGSPMFVAVGTAVAGDQGLTMGWYHHTTPASRYAAFGVVGQTELLFLTQTARVGIGTAFPASLLALNVPNSGGSTTLMGQFATAGGGSTSTGTFRVGIGEPNQNVGNMSSIRFISAWNGSSNDGSIQLWTTYGGVNNYQAMTIDRNGNIGIAGVTAPNGSFHTGGSTLFAAQSDNFNPMIYRQISAFTSDVLNFAINDAGGGGKYTAGYSAARIRVYTTSAVAGVIRLEYMPHNSTTWLPGLNVSSDGVVTIPFALAIGPNAATAGGLIDARGSSNGLLRSYLGNMSSGGSSRQDIEIFADAGTSAMFIGVDKAASLGRSGAYLDSMGIAQMTFYSNEVEVFRYDGNRHITFGGLTAGSTLAGDITVARSGTSNAGVIYFSSAGSGTAFSAGSCYMYFDGTNFQFGRGGNISVINGSGNLAYTSSEYEPGTTVKRKLHQRFIDPASALAVIRAIRPRAYTMVKIPQDGGQIGFFAEDLHRASPDLSDGRMMEPDSLLAYTVAAVQRLADRVALLEER